MQVLDLSLPVILPPLQLQLRPQLLLAHPVPVAVLVLLVAAVLQVLAIQVVEDLAVEDTVEDIDPNDFYTLDISKDGLALIYRSVCFHLEKWPGGHPEEQVALQQLKDNLFRIILEKTLES